MSSLYPYQERVKETLLQGRSVVLQAPTGAGKTRAALAPFIEAFFDLSEDAFPRQCLYSVPMRVLASQFEREHRRLAESYYRRHRRRLDVRIQTGDRAEDPTLIGDLVFATLDQVLSSALGVPYSLSESRANVNVGAVLGSYLVFDEFHLFPQQAKWSVLQLLRVLKRLVPFTLMTATFSSHMLESVAELLDATSILVNRDEVEQIETEWGRKERKAREFRVVDAALDSRTVRDEHDRRTLVVCNTVDRALEIYEGLLAHGCRPLPLTDPVMTPIYEALRQVRDPDEQAHWKQEAVSVLRHRMEEQPGAPWAMLLHSRFEQPHRQVKEELLQSLWGKDALANGGDMPSLILVATQVVEVGLDISALVLHTELAPAASVLQRAGRCARYPGERGQVRVYRLQERRDGSPDYGPYAGSKEDVAICERTWQAFRDRDGMTLHFAQEQELIDVAHGEADRAVLRAMRESEGQIWELITEAIVHGDASTRRRLIREVDSRTVIVYDAPDGLSEENPFLYEGVSLWHGTLRGKLAALHELAESQRLPWALRFPVQVEDEEETRLPVAYRWVDVTSGDDIGRALLFAVHPRLVSYDPERGFRLAEPGGGRYRSPRRRGHADEAEQYGYELESYVDHIRKMRRAFEGYRSFGEPVGGQLQSRFIWVKERFAQLQGDWRAPADLLEKAVRLVMALHDVGKLDVRWQDWAAEYQKAIGEGPPPYLVAHTHYEPSNPEHARALRDTRKHKPRTHAGEGAMAAARILWEALDGKTWPGLYRAAVTAIARHHSPQLWEAGPYRLHPQATDVVGEALATVGEEEWRAWAKGLICVQQAPNLEKRLLPAPPEGSWSWWFLYFTLVRILRLCDGMSQEEV